MVSITGKTMKTYTTACPRNCYSTCSLRVRVENNRILEIEAHPGNRATAKGPCLKGLSYVERVHSPDRILYPLRKTGRGERFKRISWEEALDRISDKLLSLRRDPGAQSVLYYTGSGTKGLLNDLGPDFWRLYGGYTTTYGDLCWPSGLEATRLTLGENTHNAPWDIARAKLILLWGKNPAETNIHQMVFIEEALDRGAKLVVIDPRRTDSSERAELLIQPRPGTDGALALAAARLLIHEKRIDEPFLKRHVLGFPEFRLLAEEYPLERAAEITGVKPQYIECLADYLGTIKPATLCAGFGMQRYTNSGQTLRALMALLALTGNIGKPGSGLVYANLQSYLFHEDLPPLADLPPSRSDGIARVSISTARLGADMSAQEAPPLRAAWVERGNPITQNPDTNRVLAAFRSLDFRVTVEQFLTDTAREADIVLPAKSCFEQSDLIGAYWHPYIQLKQKVIDPPGEVKPESEIYRLLALRIGISPATVRAVFPGPSDEEIEEFLSRKLAPFPELTLARLREGPILAPGCREVAFSDLVFKTPSGKIELVSREAKERWGLDELPRYKEAALKDRHPLYLMTPNSKNRIHSQFGNLQMIRQFDGPPRIEISPVDAAPRGIADGKRVRVFNDRGQIEVTARIDAGIRPGCLSIPNGGWLFDGAGVNLLSPGLETDMGHGAAFHDNRVEVEALHE